MAPVVCYIVWGSVCMGTQHILRNAQPLYLLCKHRWGICPMKAVHLKERNLGTPSDSISIHRSRDRNVMQDFHSLDLSSKSLVIRIELLSFDSCAAFSLLTCSSSTWLLSLYYLFVTISLFNHYTRSLIHLLHFINWDNEDKFLVF